MEFTMIIYLYDKTTTEYIGTDRAELDPRATQRTGEPVYVIPNGATTLIPLEPKKGFAICFNTKANAWEYVEDHRGETAYLKETLEEVVIQDIGPINILYFKELPKPNNEYQYWNGEKYVYPEINDLKHKLKSDLDFKYENKLQSLHRVGKYYVQPAWATIYTNTFVAMEQDVVEDGKLDNVYNILLITSTKGTLTQIQITDIAEFMPYYNKVKETYKALTEQYHAKIIELNQAPTAEKAANIILNY